MENNKYIMWRSIFVYVLLCVFGLTIVSKVIIIQFKEGEFWRQKAQNLTTLECTVDASRGNIYDANMNLIATSLPYYEVGMDVNTDYLIKLTKTEFRKQADSLSLLLAQLLKQKSRKEYLALIMEARDNGDRYIMIGKDISYKELQQMKHFPILRLGRNKGGLTTLQTNKRKRPFEQLAARTIGYDRFAVRPIGMEAAYNQYLKGTPGKRWMQKIAGGVWMPLNDENEIEPEDGTDIVSTIDINIQDVAAQSLMKQLAKNNADHGCVILMEVQTGNIKAIANLSRKDSGQYIENFNYAIGAATEPGSTFKLASLMTAMEDGYIDLNDTVDVLDGSCKFFNLTVKDSHHPTHSKMTVQQVFEQSSNVGVARIIYRHYAKQSQHFVDRLYKFNLNQPLGLAIPGEALPKIKSPRDKDWYGTSLPWMAYGYELLLTPMQILTFYNAVANNGEMVRPQFISEVLRKGQVVKKFDKEIIGTSPMCSKKTLAMARTMMEGVVLNGTGKTLLGSPFRIAGKTGTAQILVNGTYKDHDQKASYQASFVGYFPAENPKYSCMVVVSAPSTGEYYGAQVAGPVFKDVAEKVYAGNLELQKGINQLAVKPTLNLNVPEINPGSFKDVSEVVKQLNIKNNFTLNHSGWASFQLKDSSQIAFSFLHIEADLKKNIVPNLMGLGIQDALFLLENNGIRVKVYGSGTVSHQSINPGEHFLKGQTIELQLT